MDNVTREKNELEIRINDLQTNSKKSNDEAAILKNQLNDVQSSLDDYKTKVDDNDNLITMLREKTMEQENELGQRQR